jgi:hypothetical protein
MGYSTTTTQLFLDNVTPKEPNKTGTEKQEQGKTATLHEKPCISQRGIYNRTHKSTNCKGENFVLGTSPVLNKLHMGPSYERTLDANEAVDLRFAGNGEWRSASDNGPALREDKFFIVFSHL